jgi:hypothetical protein
MGSWKSQNVPAAVSTSQLINRASIAYSTAEGILMDFPGRKGVVRTLKRVSPLTLFAALLVVAIIVAQPVRTAASLADKAPDAPTSQHATAF